jgi:hypothetical protein
MKIISYDSSRLTCLFPFEEVVPLAGANDREIVEGIKNKYNFLKGPDLAVAEEIAKNGYKFENGQFSFERTNFRIANLGIYRDGIVINAPRTDGSEAFLDDLIAFVRSEFSFRDFITAPRRRFQSEVVVEFEHPLENLVQSFKSIADAISKPLNKIYETKVSLGLERLDFDVDKTMLPTPAPGPQRFILERRISVAFEHERYYSAAPLQTANHIAVLERIEELAA